MDFTIGTARLTKQKRRSDEGENGRSTQSTTETAIASRLFGLHHTKDGDGVSHPHQAVTLRVVHEHMQIPWRVHQSTRDVLMTDK